MVQKIHDIIERSVAVKTKIVGDNNLMARIAAVADVVTEALANGKKVLFCGNGGSAADAQHLAAELSGRFYFDRDPLPSEALHCNTSYLTAVANDYGYEYVYSRLVKATGQPGDVLVGLSTSGNSVNIIHAFEQAKKSGMITVAFTGESGGKIRDMCDHLLNVPSSDTPRIQESHIMIGHIICEIAEERLFKKEG